MSAVDQKTFTALGQEWTARFDFNSICEIEDRTGRPFLSVVAPFMSRIDLSDIENPEKIAAAASELRMSDFRSILYQSLRAKHPDVTINKAGEIVADMGLDGVMPVIVWAIQKGLVQTTGNDSGN